MKRAIRLIMLMLLMASLLAKPVKVSAEIKAKNCARFQSVVDALQEKVRTDQEVIRGLGLNVRAEIFDELEKMTEEARKEFWSNLTDALLEVAFAGAEVAVVKGGSLNPWNVNVAIRNLTRNGFMTDPIARLLRNISKWRDKPTLKDNLSRDLKALQMEIDVARFFKESHGEPKAKLEAIKMLFGWLPKSPQLSFVVAATQYSVALGFAGYAKYQIKPEIERLAALTEKDLRTLNLYAGLLKSHVSELRQARGALAKCEQDNTGGKDLAGTWMLLQSGETIVIRRIEGGAYSFRINGLNWTVTGKDAAYEATKLLSLEEISAINPDTPPRAASQAAAAGAQARITLELAGEQNAVVILFTPAIGYNRAGNFTGFGPSIPLDGILVRKAMPQSRR